jgi:hypothetical protein
MLIQEILYVNLCSLSSHSTCAPRVVVTSLCDNWRCASETCADLHIWQAPLACMSKRLLYPVQPSFHISLLLVLLLAYIYRSLEFFRQICFRTVILKMSQFQQEGSLGKWSNMSSFQQMRNKVELRGDSLTIPSLVAVSK